MQLTLNCKECSQDYTTTGLKVATNLARDHAMAPANLTGNAEIQRVYDSKVRGELKQLERDFNVQTTNVS